MRRATLVLASWIAVAAVLIAALAPAVSHALKAGRNGTGWMEVCSAAGVHLADAHAHADGESEPPHPDGGHPQHRMDDCPYCSVHANVMAVLGAPVVLAPASVLHALTPTAFLAAPRTLPAWLSAQPRGPPHIA